MYVGEARSAHPRHHARPRRPCSPALPRSLVGRARQRRPPSPRRRAPRRPCLPATAVPARAAAFIRATALPCRTLSPATVTLAAPPRSAPATLACAAALHAVRARLPAVLAHDGQARPPAPRVRAARPRLARAPEPRALVGASALAHRRRMRPPAPRVPARTSALAHRRRRLRSPGLELVENERMREEKE